MDLHKRSMLPVEMKEILSKISIMEIQMTTDWMMHSRLIKFYEKKNWRLNLLHFQSLSEWIDYAYFGVRVPCVQILSFLTC